MTNVIILGGKGGGTLAAQTVLALARAKGSHRLLGYLNDRSEVGTPLHGGSVIGKFDDWSQFDDARFVAPLHKAASMQLNARRIENLGIPASRWSTLVDPHAIRAEDAVVGGGSVIAAMGQIGPDSRIGAHCFLRPGAIVSHDVELSDFVFLGQTSVAGGYSRIGTGVHIAPGAVIRDGVSVGRFAIVGMGAVVTKDVPPFAIAYGVPARIVGYVEPLDQPVERA